MERPLHEYPTRRSNVHPGVEHCSLAKPAPKIPQDRKRSNSCLTCSGCAGAVLLSLGEDGLDVLLDDSVEDGLLRLPALVLDAPAGLRVHDAHDGHGGAGDTSAVPDERTREIVGLREETGSSSASDPADRSGGRRIPDLDAGRRCGPGIRPKGTKCTDHLQCAPEPGPCGGEPVGQVRCIGGVCVVGGDAGVADGGGRDAEGMDAGVDQATRDSGAVPGTWVTIPAGTFWMGSPAEEPCRRRRLAAAQ